MSAILIALVAMLALGCALYPLFREERWSQTTGEAIDPNLEYLLSAREVTYSAIKDLESDHAQGKLSDADYQSTRAKYENKALTILQQLNLLQLRAASAKAQRAPIPSACAQCGEPIKAGAKFCGRCGAPLGAPVCVNCGAAIQAEWKFCNECGAPIVALQPA